MFYVKVVKRVNPNSANSKENFFLFLEFVSI